MSQPPSTSPLKRLESRRDALRDAPHPAFVKLDLDEATRAATAAETRWREGRPLSPIDGWVTPVKDLFDVAGQTTRAGAALRANAPAAQHDAAAVARLRAAGAILLGRTHMSEFAFSGLGLNPTDPPLGNALDRTRIPGGSSSGAGVVVATGLAEAAIGSDTGGSCRIPAALNGIVGMKPSHGFIPSEGCFPLAPSLDVVGPIAPDVARCSALLGVLAGVETPKPASTASGLRLGVLRGDFLADAEERVAQAFETAISEIARAGAALSDLSLDSKWRAMLAAFPAPLVAIEAAGVHRDTLRDHHAAFDRRVAARISLGLTTSAADYLAGLAQRQGLIAAVAAAFDGLDALLCPTTPITAPPIAELEGDDDAFFAANLLMLRNPTFANLFDLCAISLPIRLDQTTSVGLSLLAPKGADLQLLEIAAAIEPVMRVS